MAVRAKNDVLAALVTRGVIASVNDAAAGSYVDQAADSIKAYCNLPVMPDALFWAWVDISSRLIASSGGGGNVASIKEGDTSVTFAAATEQPDVLSGYKPLLNRFRRLA